MTQYILVEDVTSSKKVPYAKKGDTVTLVADHGKTIIVEDKNGNRFPINSQHIISYKNELEPAIHQRVDHVEEKPGKKLRSKKANDIHSSGGVSAALTLFK